jgi:hypothetical protein
VSPGDVQAIAAAPQVRPLLYQMLSHFDALHLFPPEYLNAERQADSQLAYWIMHPNELQEAPSEMETAAVVDRQLDGRPVQFYVLRYRMREGHWAGEDWLLGVAGPFREGAEPYSEATAFSRAGDKESSTEPGDLVDWYIEMMHRKGVV